MCLQNKYKQFYQYYEKNFGNNVICLYHNEILNRIRLRIIRKLPQPSPVRQKTEQTFHNKM